MSSSSSAATMTRRSPFSLSTTCRHLSRRDVGGLLGRQRELDGERRPDSLGTAAADRPAVRLHKRLADGKPEPGPLNRKLARALGAVARPEQLVTDLGRDAHAGVGDLDNGAHLA